MLVSQQSTQRRLQMLRSDASVPLPLSVRAATILRRSVSLLIGVEKWPVGEAWWVTMLIFVATYAGMSIGRVPGLGMDRASIALVGGIAMLLSGMLTLPAAISPDCVDYPTLLLLFGMMVVVGFLRLSGLFHRLTAWALTRIHGPRALLAVTIVLAGLLSAFLINDVVCVAMAPIVLQLTRRLRYDPVPFLVAVATASNVGSAATITGNPQNIYIGVHSGIGYLRFAAHLFPVSVLGLSLDYLIIALAYRRRLGPPNLEKLNGALDDDDEMPVQIGSSWLAWKSGLVALAAVALFFTGLPLPYIALGSAAVLLVARVRVDRVFAQVDWSLLVLFVGLFLVVHAFQLHVVSRWGVDGWDWLLRNPVTMLSGVSLVLSNLVSNVPAVLLLERIVTTIPGPAARDAGWLALAMSSTLAGNLTVVGSVANLIVIESAARKGVRVSLWDYSKVGIPLALLTVGIGVVWLRYVTY